MKNYSGNSRNAVPSQEIFKVCLFPRNYRGMHGRKEEKMKKKII